MATRKKTKMGLQQYRLRVGLQDVEPRIWRQIWVEDQMSLGQLHHILQAAMGWTDAHLHEFTIDGQAYAIPHPEDDPNRVVIDERKIRLGDILTVGLSFDYQYDFGDNWHHTVHVEEVLPLDQPNGAGYVAAGERACPPEDCGGSGCYQDYLELLDEEPDCEEVRSFLQWAGEDFDPGRFDRHAANAALLRMAWNRWGVK